jgi:hypothetical protein
MEIKSIEKGSAIEHTERQRIAVKTEVVEVIEASWSRHVAAGRQYQHHQARHR